MREYTSLLELVRSEPLISENITATYLGMWHPKHVVENVRYVYKTTIIEGLNIYMHALRKEHGIEKWYYESGELKYEIPYEHGKKYGIEKLYYESGELKRESPFTNSKRHGILKEYYKNGQIKEESLYDNSELKGTNSYDENGQIIK